MSREHVGHGELAQFAASRVNLPKVDADSLRTEANGLREKLETYLAENPDFELRKMLLSGSLAKGTALRSTSDIDLACYVSSESAPHEVPKLIEWLAERLRKAYPNFKPEQVKPKEYSVCVEFKGTGNEIDIVPIFYAEDPDWKGDLVSQDTGETLMTSVPMHLDFIRKRKQENAVHFAQVVRLLKFWSKLCKENDPDFRFKSFMVELLVAHLADRGTKLNDYPEAVASFFTFIVRHGLRDTIAFADYYDPKTCGVTNAPVRIWDPVNCENNVAKLYTTQQKEKIVRAAAQAVDAIDAALYAMTKADTVRYWQKIFGPSFSV